MQAGKLYVFTLPKAGTYFLAGLLAWFGWRDTGWHVAERFVLDTHSTDLVTNARNPLAVRVEKPYARTLDDLPLGGMCFGHMNPMLFPAPHAAQVTVIGCTRHPRDLLVAEFIDFRFRREDSCVAEYSRDAIPDHADAFATYVERHGPVIADIVGTFLTYRALRMDRIWCTTRTLAPWIEVRFEDLMGSTPLPALRRLADLCGVVASDDRLMKVLAVAKAADNKTKSAATELPFARVDIWTPKAEQWWHAHGFPELSARLGYLER